MNLSFKLSLALCIAAFSAGAISLPQTYETPAEFIAYGDYDGDGDLDAALVDKASGEIRFAKCEGDDFTWSSRSGMLPIRSGVIDVSAVAVGEFLKTGEDALVVSSDVGNRVTIVPYNSNRDLKETFSNVGIGIKAVAGVEVTTEGRPDSDLPGLVVFSDLNHENLDSDQWSLLTRDGDDLAVATQSFEEIPTCRFAASLNIDGNSCIAALNAASGGEQFAIYSADTANGLNEVAVLSDILPEDVRFVHAPFSGENTNDFLFYKGEDLWGCSLDAVAGEFSAVSTFASVSETDIQTLFVLPQMHDEGAAYVLGIVLADGTAAVYAYDGTNTPTKLQDITTDYSSSYDIGILVGYYNNTSNYLAVLECSSQEPCEQYRRFGYYSSEYSWPQQPRDMMSLHSVNPSNIILYTENPFENPLASIVARYQRDDWTNGYFGFNYTPPKLNVRVEYDAGEIDGLGSLMALNLDTFPNAATFALTNQIRPDVSMFSLKPASGRAPLSVAVSPEPGTYEAAVGISFVCSDPAAHVFYRFGNGEWCPYDAHVDAEVLLYYDETVTYYATNNFDGVSPLQTAEYTFTSPRFEMDSDDDGIPDFVEAEHGFDPLNSGPDGNENGIIDIEEIIDGQLASVLRCGFSTSPIFPKSLDDPGYLSSKVGNRVSAYNLAGGMYDRADTVLVRGGNDSPMARLELDIDPGTFIVLATDAEFAVSEGELFTHGRQVITVLRNPHPALPELDYTYGGGTPTEEAALWVAEAKQKWGATDDLLHQETVLFGDVDTIAALIFERIVHECFVERGLADADDILTVTPFRLGEKQDYYTVSTADMVKLTTIGADTPGYDLNTILIQVRDQLDKANGDTDIALLKALARNVYRVAVESEVALRQPLDVMRRFVAGGELDPKYGPQLALSKDQIDQARAGVQELLGLRTGRQLVHRQVRITAGTFADPNLCLVKDTEVAETIIQLVDSLGEPGLKPSFDLLPNTILDVYGYVQDAAERGQEILTVVAAEVVTMPQTALDDSDGDGMSDAWELLFFGDLSRLADGDEDQDGSKNRDEYGNATDPKDENSFDIMPAPTPVGADGHYALGHQYIEFTVVLPAVDCLGDYEIQVAETEDVDFSNPLVELTSPEPANGRIVHQTTHFLNSGSYLWRVRAISCSGVAGHWSTSASLTVDYHFVVKPGWNLLASPVDSDQTVADIFSQSATLFAWNGAQYVRLPTDAPLPAGIGFWYYSSDLADSIAFTGIVPAELPSLANGWHMIGNCPGLMWPLEGLFIAWRWDGMRYQRFPLEDLGNGIWFHGSFVFVMTED